jgi:hypothetical protein
MSEQLQLRSGTYAQVAAFKGASAECVVDTTNNRLVIQDGVTTGGWAAGLEVRTAVADGAYTVLPTDRIVAYTSITAARAVSLPAAASYPPGARLLVVDESGSCSAANTITINRNGTTDTIDGQASVLINSSYGYIGLESNGSNAWTIIMGKSTVAQSPHGASIQFFVTEFLQSVSGTTVTCGTQLPYPALIFSVGVYVLTSTGLSVATGTTGFSVGDQISQGDSGASNGRFATGVGLGYQSASAGLASSPFYNWEATNILLTATGGSAPSFTSGQVRISIHYAVMSPSNS